MVAQATVWTDEMVNALTRLSKNSTLTASGIAQRINEAFNVRLTRASVQSAMQRRGLRAPTLVDLPSPPLVPDVVVTNRGAEDSGLAKSIKNRTGDAASLTGDEATDLEVEAIPTRVTLLASREGQCRWPAADDGSAALVCGATVHRTSYCQHHYLRSVAQR
ncbi:GcrA family cell cycle regulator [Afipia carboxidovorans]|uniref:GcrA family cell cycle regulator n=1 Tax=Afipia carboxidovorans TaxID=40137 RepID=UPI00308FFCEF|nr:hypothetical protein CRBSH125_05800 [Afipia carboxidovorans]